MTFISIMGTQVMAVLNPLLALIENKCRPDSVHLLATKYTGNMAKVVAEFLVRKSLFTAEEIRISDISSDLEADTEGRPPAAAVLDQYRETGGIFSIAGGMNFQIIACVQGLYDVLARFQLVYPERDKIHVIRIGSGVVHSYKQLSLPPPLALLEMLDLQGVGYEKEETDEQGFLFRELRRCGIAPPSNGVAMNIRSVFFDYVWNEASGLKMIKTLETKALEANHKKAIAEVRDIIAFATSRDDSDELYHREIAVLTDYALAAERLRKEGDDKVKVWEKDHIGLLPAMRRFFGISGEPVLTERPRTIATGNRADGDSSLYAVLGQDITPTLIAIWSHRPKKVNLFYTPADAQIAFLKENISRLAALLPVSEVSFYPVGIAGKEILSIPPPKGTEAMEVNISPGTKSQGMFLMLHALNRGGRVFSIKTKTQTLEELPGDAQKEIAGPDPAILAQMKGYRIKKGNEGLSAFDLKEKGQFYEGLLCFLRRVFETNQDIPLAYLNGKRLENLSFDWEGEKTAILTRGKDRLEEQADRGECFERLIGFVMMEAGSGDVRVRLRTAWDKNLEKIFEKRHQQESFMTDVDVVARFLGRYYAISCKSGTNYRREDELKSIKAVDNLFGRYCIPMFVSLDHTEPAEPRDGVYCFGPATFTDPAAMTNLLELAAKQSQKALA